MPIEFLSDAMRRIVSSQQDAEELGSGFGGPHGPAEGPVWWKEGGYLLFSDIHASRRMKWEPGRGISIDKEGTANANGQTRDRQGRLVACHHFSRCVDRLEADGSVTVIADRYRGLKLNRPNDVVVKSDGSIYFSDPPPRPPLTPPEHTPELDLGSERMFCDMRGDDRPGVPDGMKVDVEGNVYCTGPGGIWVLSPDGEHIGTIGHRAVNLNWGDDDWQTLYFTGPTTLHRIRLNIPGIPVPRGSLEL